MIPRLNPTSKVALKQQCLMIAEGDIEKAERIYDFMAKDLDDLPTFDTIPPTMLQQVKEGAVGTMSWLNENKNDILDWVGIIRGMFAKGGGVGEAPTNPIPPIN